MNRFGLCFSRRTKPRWIRLSYCLLLSTFGSSPASALTEVPVRLRPLHGVISVSGFDLKVFDKSGGEVAEIGNLSAAPFRSLKLKFDPATALRQERWLVFNVAKDSSGGSELGQRLAVIKDSSVALEGRSVRVDLRPAPDKIRLVAKSSSRAIHLLGLMPLEKYLERVVSSEVPGDWPLEALKAQAVAARSYAVARLSEKSIQAGDTWLESNVIDQVFDFDRRHERAAEAVQATAGEILVDRSTDAGPQLAVKAHFHSDCGGRTDDPKAIWGSGQVRTNGFRKSSVADTACANNGRSQWRYVATLADLTERLSARAGLPKGFKIANLEVDHRTAGGRALTLRLLSSEQSTVLLPGEKLRSILGYSEIRSTLFNVKRRGDRLEFNGRGYGHGAGLCQWGAKRLALDGKSHQEILSHYYPDLKLSRL